MKWAWIRNISAGLAVAGLVGCSSTGGTSSRVEGITTTVENPATAPHQDELQATIIAELESWDERLSDLRARALTTRSPERFDQLNDSIRDIEGKLADARKEFLEMRIASSDGARLEKKQEVNETLAEIRTIYNKIPAE